MGCCIQELRNKDVICSSNGCRLGNVDDVEIDTVSGRLVCIVIFERGHFFGKGCDIKIPWENIKVIGDDTILVDYCIPNNPTPTPKRKFF
ncbi:MAG: YlmC/YmxH family sporulation protein [Clostridia bacterium]|nr:YlmC/YmxH family sporulation protein [Clostridia bacterium]